jgi:2-keto-4-pentenoate hydratase/2-oxohepta-3-ene-1,7-dioic acid hydratase in catechol pathway
MAIDKIICVGKNYLEHAKELGDAVPEKPVVFLKPSSVLQQANAWKALLELNYIDEGQVQPECEIVFRLARDAYQIKPEDAIDLISDISLGLDMTLRTRQTLLKQQGHPWTTAKVFKDAAIVGPWLPYPEFNHLLDVNFTLEIDDVLKQQGNTHDMMMNPFDLLSYLSHYFPLKQGDLIFTGTPAGVSSIQKGSTARLSWDKYHFGVKWI